MKTKFLLLFVLTVTSALVSAADNPPLSGRNYPPLSDKNYGEGKGQWATHDGIAKATGPDQWTYVNTSVWAELKMKNGMASEFLVKNCYAKHSIYISGATGTNQRDTGSGHMGQEVKPGQTISLPLGYQSKDHPITEAPFTYKYWIEGVQPAAAPKPSCGNLDDHRRIMALSRSIDKRLEQDIATHKIHEEELSRLKAGRATEEQARSYNERIAAYNKAGEVFERDRDEVRAAVKLHRTKYQCTLP